MKLKQFYGVNVLVFDSKKGLLFCIKRSESDRYFGGMYAFPGGEINPGESVQSAARREFLEETGYELSACSNTKLIITVRTEQVQFNAQIVEGVLGKQVSTELDSEITEFRWITVEEFVNSLREHEYSQSEIDKLYRLIQLKRSSH